MRFRRRLDAKVQLRHRLPLGKVCQSPVRVNQDLLRPGVSRQICSSYDFPNLGVRDHVIQNAHQKERHHWHEQGEYHDRLTPLLPVRKAFFHLQRAFHASDLEIKNSMEDLGAAMPAKPKSRGGR